MTAPSLLIPRRALADIRQRFGVGFLTVALAVAAISIYELLSSGPIRTPGAPTIPWWALAVLYLLAESFPVHLSIGKETQSFSLSELPLTLGLFLSAPGDLLLGQAVGAALALTLKRRNSFRKLSFNLSSFAFSTAVAIVVFQVLGDPTNALGPRDWLAGFAAALVADFVSGVTVQVVISVSSGTKPDWAGSAAGAIYVLANASLGLVGTLLLVTRPETAWLAGVLTLAIYGAYRISEHQRERHNRVLGLHDATRTVQDALSAQSVADRVLERACAMFGAESAELLVLPHDSTPAIRTRITAAGEVTREPVDRLDATEGVWARVASEGEAVLITTAAASERLREHLQSRGIRELMAAPVRGRDRVVAVLTLMNRQGNVGGWSNEELPLLETLANHAGIALRNGELLEGLAARAAENEFQARHDALTGLPNRTWFAQLVDEAVASEHPPAALLVADLDRFKEINDTLGSQNGDVILKAVAERLRGLQEKPMVVARLSADEFALLVEGEPAVDSASAAAARVLQALDQPFAVSGLMLNISASLGVALVGRDGIDSGTLMRHADVAMYQAKSGHRAVEFYAAERDEFSPARLALAGEFRRAIDTGELVPWFQPKVDVASGRVVGGEALARWIHPVRGVVRPDDFIPIIEQTNLLRPMTMLILREAVERCASWHAQGFRMGVAVNLSPRNLVDDDLVRSIGATLDAAGLPATALTLEITESAMMDDPDRAIATLREIRELGCKVAVDDFGSGHASLAYLKHLPVDELKIDKSFVTNLETDRSDQSIVRSTIELAHELGLVCVAEGVESAWTLDWLGAQNCDLAQGFLTGMAVPAEEFERIARMRAHGAPGINPARTLGARARPRSVVPARRAARRAG